MGIKNMLKFLNTNYPNTIKKIETMDFEKKKIAIDISIMLYQVVINIRNSGADMVNNQGEITSHILGLFNKTINLLKMNIIPVYVFDGKPPEFKSKVLEERRDVKNKAYEKLNEDLTEEEKIKYFKRTVSISKKQIEQCIELLDTMGVPYIVAPGEADSQCAYLAKVGLVDGVLTDDMDIMTFGAPKIYRNLASYNKDNLEISMSDVLTSMDMNYEQFVELCILFGCDYCERFKDIKQDTIYRYYKGHHNIPDTLNHLKEDGNNLPNVSIEEYNKIKEYFMNPEIKKIDNVDMKKCDVKKLEQLLVQRYGLVKLKIINKLNLLDNFFVTV
jgi:flap endonuclease-1